MYLPAISMGCAVPEVDFAASVHSVFQSALNLRVNGGRRLLTLLASGESDLPQGIRLDTPAGFSFEGLQTGERALCRESILSFENSSLTVQLRGARRWKCDLPALAIDPSNPSVSAAWRCVWEALNKRQKLSESEIVAEDLFRLGEPAQAGVARKVGGALRELIASTRRYELATSSAVGTLIGLGSGLTPSGDDLLVGYVGGLWCSVRHSSERLQFISSLGKRIIRLSRKTNDISRTYLYHAVRGQVSSRLADLAEAICHGEDRGRLLDIAEAAMKIGHTSGMDAVNGMLLGLAAWEGNQLFST
ncbi:MAG TPA: DUF2877 domain-containing protein [Anaerolineales bacterium]|nr:DUF2877 domain-containing protein [Anaerolineales bacterium]